MTNETYLVVSYFAAAGGGAVLAGGTALVLRGPLREAVANLLAPVAALLRRALPAWLVLVALFAFLSVSYIDCEHPTYESVVADRAHLVAKSHEQVRSVLGLTAVGVLAYSLALTVALILAHPRPPAPSPRSPRPDELIPLEPILPEPAAANGPPPDPRKVPMLDDLELP